MTDIDRGALREEWDVSSSDTGFWVSIEIAEGNRTSGYVKEPGKRFKSEIFIAATKDDPPIEVVAAATRFLKGKEWT